MKNLLSCLFLSAVVVSFFCCQPKSADTTDTAEKTEKTEEKKTNVKPEEKKLSKTGYQVGDVVEDFSLKNTNDEMIALSDYKDEEGVIVIFTCNTCPYAVAYEDRIIELHEEFSQNGFPVIAINPNDPEVKPGDSFEAMKVRAQEKRFSFAYVFDEAQSVYPKWGATRTPEIYLLKNQDDGTMKVAYTGAIDNNWKDAASADEHYLAKAIKAVKTGVEPDPNFTKAIGCTIKVKKN
ncbi:MAG: thioredoxin family protein [Bacteroidota bacterium]